MIRDISIMNKIFTLLSLFISFFLFSQNRKGQFFIADYSQNNELYVAFENNLEIHSTNYTEEISKINVGFANLSTEFSIHLEKGLPFSDEKLLEMTQQATNLKKDASAIKNLRTIFKIQFENSSNDRILALATKLEELSIVRYCEIVSSSPIKPPTDIAPITPSYVSNQGYIQANPGVNMQYAWDLGFNGQGIRMRDVEYGFNKNHEEMNSTNTSIASGMTVSSSATLDYTEHGTAVFGILYADNGTYGVTGLANGASELILYPEWQQTGYNRANAVSQSINNSTLGDIIVFEMQTDGATSAQNDYVPAEFSQIIWDLTKAATDSGIIIVAAAGNGNQNLDGSPYLPYMNRGNSGAILVGAGTSNLNHNKISYSTYGSRIDVQAWGENVQSTGKLSSLSYFQIANDINQSYVLFSGTSAATPIVAACAAVLQSYYYSLYSSYMDPSAMRNVLISTGIQQGTGGHIGPIPNMQTAMQFIYNEYLSSEKTDSLVKFFAYPNPTENEIRFVSNESSVKDAILEIVNSVGQVVYKETFNINNPVDVSNFATGMYFIKISNNDLIYRQKIYKK